LSGVRWQLTIEPDRVTSKMARTQLEELEVYKLSENLADEI